MEYQNNDRNEMHFFGLYYFFKEIISKESVTF